MPSLAAQLTVTPDAGHRDDRLFASSSAASETTPLSAQALTSAPGSDAAAVRAMLEAVPERGRGIRIVRSGRAILGLAGDDRLPDEGSICVEGPWAAVVVGTVDDPPERREADSPARALLELVRSGGPRALEEVRGVFAAVITDGRRAWAARDHVGTETLYYHRTDDRLLLVSEPKQLQAFPGLRLEPDRQVAEAIFYGEEYEPFRSVYRDVRRLEMASFLEWSDSGISISRYWHPERLFETARLSRPELQERFDRTMRRAVGRALRPRTAVLLSGGIDSPAVAAYTGGAAEPSGDRVGAISALFPDHPSVDERELIERVAEEFGLELHTFTPGPLRLDRLAEWVYAFDGPWAAWHPGWADQTYGFAAERGYRVLLTGFFAENIADLPSGVAQYLLTRGRIRPALRYLADRRARGAHPASVLRQLLAGLAPRSLVSLYRRLRPRGIVPPWMDRRRIVDRDRRQAVAPRDLWRTAQLGFLGGPHPAMEAYAKLQARCGVRVRHPWSDVDLWELFISLPAEVKHPDSRSKALIRDLLRDRVPDVILDRPKMVFNDFITDRIDYASLRRWLVDPPVRLDGIDYDLLAERLMSEDLPMSEYLSAKDLATAHAFLAQWT